MTPLYKLRLHEIKTLFILSHYMQKSQQKQKVWDMAFFPDVPLPLSGTVYIVGIARTYMDKLVIHSHGNTPP